MKPLDDERSIEALATLAAHLSVTDRVRLAVKIVAQLPIDSFHAKVDLGDGVEAFDLAFKICGRGNGAVPVDGWQTWNSSGTTENVTLTATKRERVGAA